MFKPFRREVPHLLVAHPVNVCLDKHPARALPLLQRRCAGATHGVVGGNVRGERSMGEVVP